MTRALRHPVEIGEDDPISLAEACELFFGGRLSPSALRTEAGKGNLAILQIARKDFVTRRAIEEMKTKCLKGVNLPGSGSETKPTTTVPNAPGGSSKTAPAISAQDALRIKLEKRSESYPNTSQKSTKSPAAVVLLK